MASQQEIIREYLVSLGFKINKQEQKDFGKALEDVGKTAKVLTKGLFAAGAAIAAMAASFAISMDRLYYASQKAYSSAGNLKALEFAGRQIGMTAEAVDGMVGGLMMTLRTDPGMRGWLQSLGVDASEARQGADIWLDFIDKIRDRPFYEGAQFAEMIGMSPDQLFQVEANLDRFKGAIGQRLKMAADSGLDQDKAAEEGRDLANKFGTLAEKFGIWIDRIDSSILPHMDSIIGRMDDLFKLVDRALGWVLGKTDDVAKYGAYGAMSKWEGGATGAEHDDKVWRPEDHGFFAKVARGGLAGLMNYSNDNISNPPNAAEGMYNLENKYGLPHGTLDFLWNRESTRSHGSMVSPKGALGPFQFMPDTAKSYGIKNPFSFGESSEGAAKYMQDLIRKYGSLETAMQAYNWGEPKMDRYLGAKAAGREAYMPDETKNFTRGLDVRPITININESRSPRETAKAVKKELDVAASDQQRWTFGTVQ